MRTQFICLAFVAVLICHGASAQWVQTNGPYGGHVTCFAASGSNVFAGTFYGGIFRSTDFSTFWTAANTGLTYPSVHALAASGPVLVAGTGGGGVFVSADGGASWSAASSGLMNPDVRCLAVSSPDGEAGTHYLYAGTAGSGVFRSTDNGNSWTATGLGDACITALAVGGTWLFAGESSIGGGGG